MTWLVLRAQADRKVHVTKKYFVQTRGIRATELRWVLFAVTGVLETLHDRAHVLYGRARVLS